LHCPREGFSRHFEQNLVFLASPSWISDAVVHFFDL
jgi:hypothetical protein